MASDNGRMRATVEHSRNRAFEARDVGAAVLLGIAYYAGVHAGIALTFPSSPVSTLWPPNALVLAALLLTPPRLWWLMLAAVLPAHFAAEISLGVPLAMAALWFVSNVFEALLGATLIVKIVGLPPSFERVRDMSVFLLAGVVLAPLLSSFVDAAFVALVGWRYTGFWEVWRIRLFSNSLATLILVPPIVIWFQAGIASLGRKSLAELAERALLIASTALASAVVFVGVFSLREFALYPYVPLPFLLWAAVRWGIPGVSLCAAILAGFALTGLLKGLGPFSSGEPHRAAFTVQTFLIIVESSLLLLAASLSELRRAKLAAAHQKESLDLALDAAGMGTWQWDFATERFSWRSPDAGTPRGAVQSRSSAGLLDLVHKNDRDAVRRALDDARRNGGPWETECRFIGGRDGYRWITIRGQVQAGAKGAARRMIGVFIDTSHRKTQEMQARAQREQLAHLGRISTLGELSGAIAHELNQPLTAILFNAQAALRELDSTSVDYRELAEMLEDIVSEDKRAGDVIRRLRALLMKGAIEPQPVNLNECIEDVLGLERADLVAHHVITHTQLETGMVAIIGDRVQLQQVLLNLVANARDAMTAIDPRGRLLHIASSMADGIAHVEVCDTGSGIPDTEAIFEPFFSTKEHGIGMGLSICRTIITAHGGRLWASNNSGRGATFHISIPATVGAPDVKSGRLASLP